MKTKKITLLIMIAAIAALSFSANAQQNKNQMKPDTTRGNNRMMNPDSGYNKSGYNKKDPMNQNQHNQYHNDTMVLQNNKMLHQMKTDHIMMQNGKMVMVKDGNTMPINKDMTMKNGTILMTNGKYKMKNGTAMMMKEGDMMDMNGGMITTKKPTPK